MRVADIVDIQQWLERDAAHTPEAARLLRDQRIAASTGAAERARRPLERIARWWSQARTLEQHASVLQAPGAAVEATGAGAGVSAALVLTHAVLGLMGAAIGAVSASAVFHFDGVTAINVLVVLGVFVFAQVLFVLLSLLLLPSARLLLPVQQLVAAFNLGHLAAAVLDRVRRLRGAGGVPLWRPAQAPELARVGRWQFLAFAQSAALAFNVGALATAVALVVFTDLAFGWRTTLRVDAADLQSIVRVVAAPWAALLPAAVPSAALIEATRDFRLGSGELDALRATGWWPFLLCAMVVYGALPRLLLAMLCAWRLRTARVRLLLAHPEVVDLLARMASPQLARGVDGTEPSRGEAVGKAAAMPNTGSGCEVVIWAQAMPDADAAAKVRALGMTPARVHRAGHDVLAADSQLLTALAADRADAKAAIVVVCKGYEPPTLDLLDFVAAAATLQPPRSIVLVPDFGQVVPGERDGRVWRDAVARAGASARASASARVGASASGGGNIAIAGIGP